MADVSRPRDRSAHPHLPPTAGLDGLESGTAAEAALQAGSPAARRVGWGFISLYTLAYLGTVLVLLAPLLVTLALKINSLVGIHQAPASLALVTGTGALVAMLGNPFFGKMSDRTSWLDVIRLLGTDLDGPDIARYWPAGPRPETAACDGSCLRTLAPGRPHTAPRRSVHWTAGLGCARR
jgi:hypothetical protein